METKSPANESMEVLFSNLEKFFRTETVVGQPIEIGETTLIPIITLSFGAGGGGGGGNDEKGNGGTGTGMGVGARITADAVLVIKNGEVSMLPVRNKCNLDRLVAMVPDLVKKIKFKKDDATEE